ncbi:hypothetical protein AXK58_24235 [Tsukamurella tyrosinosolvens]|uniref:Uncharacterized protein n=1 Tax=Tsukamurella tyrosinosolvens TaxID=57704 RepID=A0A1H4UN32_TSUTY|nr:DUF6354 family protein [Tsukamurella tyrosinosolvens]KXO99066.1 hypothetical protein AXK58_24235 [Tsukamurella tyrosinosolvens]SEC69808.1 hypothetical protein SAMN04489793_2950 [Tsukamurella tyrosinosolvens]
MSAASNNPHGVEKGQVWADNDKRMAGRELRVLEVGDTHATVTEINDTSGRTTQIRLDRFKPTSTGYRRTL